MTVAIGEVDKVLATSATLDELATAQLETGGVASAAAATTAAVGSSDI